MRTGLPRLHFATGGLAGPESSASEQCSRARVWLGGPPWAGAASLVWTAAAGAGLTGQRANYNDGLGASTEIFNNLFVTPCGTVCNVTVT
jgi:hypothetical protein